MTGFAGISGVDVGVNKGANPKTPHLIRFGSTRGERRNLPSGSEGNDEGWNPLGLNALGGLFKKNS